MGAAWAPRILSILRIMAGLLFLQHGAAKYLGIPEMSNYANLQVASPSGIAGIVELICGMLIVLGLFTRPAAFIASGTMAAAYFMAHAPRDFYPIINAGELAVLYCFVFFYLIFAGGGTWSLDSLMRKQGVANNRV
jgi:putative oxidoreductase